MEDISSAMERVPSAMKREPSAMEDVPSAMEHVSHISNHVKMYETVYACLMDPRRNSDDLQTVLEYRSALSIEISQLHRSADSFRNAVDQLISAENTAPGMKEILGNTYNLDLQLLDQLLVLLQELEPKIPPQFRMPEDFDSMPLHDLLKVVEEQSNSAIKGILEAVANDPRPAPKQEEIGEAEESRTERRPTTPQTLEQMVGEFNALSRQYPQFSQRDASEAVTFGDLGGMFWNVLSEIDTILRPYRRKCRRLERELRSLKNLMEANPEVVRQINDRNYIQAFHDIRQASAQQPPLAQEDGEEEEEANDNDDDEEEEQEAPQHNNRRQLLEPGEVFRRQMRIIRQNRRAARTHPHDQRNRSPSRIHPYASRGEQRHRMPVHSSSFFGRTRGRRN